MNFGGTPFSPEHLLQFSCLVLCRHYFIPSSSRLGKKGRWGGAGSPQEGPLLFLPLLLIHLTVRGRPRIGTPTLTLRSERQSSHESRQSNVELVPKCPLFRLLVQVDVGREGRAGSPPGVGGIFLVAPAKRPGWASSLARGLWVYGPRCGGLLLSPTFR